MDSRADSQTSAAARVRHLDGAELPMLALLDATGANQAFWRFAKRSVVYVYPSTGVPGRDPLVDPAPGWDEIPGAAGCTRQGLGFRETHAKFRERGFNVAGVSSQPAVEQRDFIERHRLPYPLFSDPELALADALDLPTFVAGGRRFYGRLSFVVVQRRIVHVRYPVPVPDADAEQLAIWLACHFEDGGS